MSIPSVLVSPQATKLSTELGAVLVTVDSLLQDQSEPGVQGLGVWVRLSTQYEAYWTSWARFSCHVCVFRSFPRPCWSDWFKTG